jgi:hypothetical protein
MPPSLRPLFARAAWRLGAMCALATLVGTGCGGDAVGVRPFPESGPPASFEVRFDAYGYGSLTATLEGDALVVRHLPDWRISDATTTTVVPTAADWAAFWESARRARLHRWPRSCVDDRVVDGGGISVDIAYAGGRIEAATTNAYPTGAGGCVRSDVDPTGEYMEFVGAMERLIRRSFP